MRSAKIVTLTAILLFWTHWSFSQVKYWEQSYQGGVVTGGWSLGINSSGSGSFTVAIPAGSTIRSAYFIAGRLGPAPDITVTLNGNAIALNASNTVTSGFTSIYGGASGVHVADVTSIISPATTNYTITCPATGAVSNKWVEFYLFIAFDNPSYPAMTSVIWLNNQTFAGTLTWAVTTSAAITSTSPVAWAALGGYANNTASDCERVTVNGTLLGDWRGPDFNATTAYGAMGCFQYYNNTLTGYGDDNPNLAIANADVLSDVSGLIPNGSTSANVVFTHCSGASDNHPWAMFMAWSGGVVLPAQHLSMEAERLPDGQVDVEGLFLHQGGFMQCQLERSLDGTAFAAVGELRALENALGEQAQAWRDADAPAQPLWYRSKLIDADGKFQYSNPVEVGPATHGSFLLKAWPSPLALGESLQATLYGSGPLQVRVFEAASGRQLHAETIILPGQGSQAISLSSADWGTGIRIVEFVLDGRRATRLVSVF